MTQEEKSLLLQDLSARLPYGVNVNFEETQFYTKQVGLLFNIDIEGSTSIRWEDITHFNPPLRKWEENCRLDCVRPYLRPMSSMTEEELRDFAKIKFEDDTIWEIAEFPKMKCYKGFINVKCRNKNSGDTWTFQVNTRTPLETYYGIDWLNAHHFDYRGLIEKGLALEAPEGMYNF